MQKPSLKAGVTMLFFSVLEVKRSKILQIFNKRDCFCLHSWFHFLQRFLVKNGFTQEIFDLTLHLDHLSIKLNYCRSKSSLKALSVLKIFKFLSYFLVIYKDGLIRNIRLILKFMTSQPR